MLQITAGENTSRTYELVGHDFDWWSVFPRWLIIVDSFTGQHVGGHGKTFPRHCSISEHL